MSKVRRPNSARGTGVQLFNGGSPSLVRFQNHESPVASSSFQVTLFVRVVLLELSISNLRVRSMRTNVVEPALTSTVE